MAFHCVLACFFYKLVLHLYGQGVHDALVHLDTVLGFLVPGANLRVVMFGDILHGKMHIVCDKIYAVTAHISNYDGVGHGQLTS